QDFCLSIVGLEQYDHLFMPKSSYPLFVKGQGTQAGSYVSSTHFNEFINWQSFRQDKGVETFRIFVIGDSAAYGWPYVDKFGFTGHLRRAFEAVLPGRVEIINVAGMSYGSHRVLDVLRDVLLHAPDLVIVYSGNNEYVERNVLPDAVRVDGFLAKMGGVLGRTDTYRAVRLGLFRAAPGVFAGPRLPDITDIRSKPELERGSLGRSAPIDTEVLGNFRANLGKIKEMLLRRQVKGIFCTVPVNIGGWIPTVDEPKFASENEAARWAQLYERKEEAFRMGSPEMEAGYLKEMLAITPDDPGLLFNYGKVLWSIGRREESYRELVRAKDLDVRPMRSLSSFNEYVRSLGNEGQGVYLADLESGFRELYLSGSAEKLFLDYCHFTDFGHKTVAKSLLPVIQKAMAVDLPLDRLENQIMADTIATTMDRQDRAKELYARAITLQNNQRLEETIAAYKQVLALTPDSSAALSNLGKIYLEQGNLGEARGLYLKALEFHPENIEALIALGLISLNGNNLEQAEQYFRKACAINPYSPAATLGLAEAAMQRRDAGKAIPHFEKTLQLGRDNFMVRRGLGDAYLMRGEIDNALLHWRSALAFNPYDQETRTLVEKYARKN
ncbi:MAG: tetratricopeptide repeat protein, partial [Desulfobulbaceae bacterium]